jgi:hypothetical protein
VLVQDGEEELVLAAESGVDRAGRVAGLGADLLDRRAVEPVLREDLPRRLDQVVSRSLRALPPCESLRFDNLIISVRELSVKVEKMIR